MNKFGWFLGMSVFILGWLASSMFAYVSYADDVLSPLNLFSTSSPDIESPSDWIKENQIHVYGDYIKLDIENAIWSKFADSNSMDPFLDQNSNGIEIRPESPDQISVGDIISYKSEYTTGVIIHRVIEKGQDDQGTFFIIKGDNNSLRDPGKIRFSQIEGVLVGIIY